MLICHQLLITVIWLFFLVKRIHSVCSELLVETVDINKHLLVILVVHCLLLDLPPRLSDSTHQKKLSSSDSLVLQLRSMLRIMLDLDSSNIQRILLWHQMLPSDSVLTGEEHLIIVLKFWVLQIQHSRVLMYPRVSSPECTPMIRVKNGISPITRYVNSIYGKIGGSAFVNGDGETRKISVFGYYGDDRDPGTSGSLFGIGGAAESRGITPPLEDTVIFTLNGTAASKFNPHWRGRPDGSPRLYGTPGLQLLFTSSLILKVRDLMFMEMSCTNH